MKINKLELSGFRNLEPLTLTPSPGINVIHGKNAQGKTNLLESVWMCCGMKSFRGAKDAELKGFEKQAARVSLVYSDARRENTVELKIAQKRQAFLNGVGLPSPAGLIGKFRAVVFSPSFLSIVQAGPAERRRFLDAAVCQIRPAYAGKLAEYNRLLRQRNALIKDAFLESALLDMLEVLDGQLCAAAEALTKERLAYLALLTPFACGIYDGLSGGKETISFRYLKKGGERGETYEEIFRAGRKTDFLNKTTCAGPHRDESATLRLDGIVARG